MASGGAVMKNEWSGIGFKVRVTGQDDIQVDLDTPDIRTFQAYQLASALIEAAQMASTLKKTAT